MSDLQSAAWVWPNGSEQAIATSEQLRNMIAMLPLRADRGPALIERPASMSLYITACHPHGYLVQAIGDEFGSKVARGALEPGSEFLLFDGQNDIRVPGDHIVSLDIAVLAATCFGETGTCSDSVEWIEFKPLENE